MKKLIFTALSALLLAGCLRDNLPKGPGEDKNEWNGFSFSTVTNTQLSVDYGIPTAIYFEVYDQMPVALNADGTVYIKKSGIEPLYVNTTSKDGRFSGSVELPTYLDKAYIYTSSVVAQTLLTAVKTNDTGLIAAADMQEAPEATQSATRASYESVVISSGEWKAWLGDYKSSTGIINYALRSNDPLRVTNWEKLYVAANQVFNIDKACPKEYRSETDLYISEAANVAVTYLSSNTCWNCSMGYYYYKEDNVPTSIDQIHPILIFPNTQDGQWSVDPKLSKKYKGVERGTAVKLMFYPNIANGSISGATDIFPAGYRIGFILATNAWTNRLPSYPGDVKYRATTSKGLSINKNGAPFNEARTAVYRYTNEAENLNSIICSFEDYTSDDNFSDIIFTIKSNPVDAVTDLPEVDEKPDHKEVKLLKGIYAFEDLWPSRGDYDMNDVIVRLDYNKKFSTEAIFEESFLFTAFGSPLSGSENGLAFTLHGGAASARAELSFSILRPNAAEFEPYAIIREDNVILLTENVKTPYGAIYKVTAKYDEKNPIPSADASSVKPFIFRATDPDLESGKRKEVHLPFEAPTAKIDMKFFGMGDDLSDPATNRYYVRANNYPFAIFLSGATEADIIKLLDKANEKTEIDKLYPDYPEWAGSNGTKNQDWYK